MMRKDVTVAMKKKQQDKTRMMKKKNMKNCLSFVSSLLLKNVMDCGKNSSCNDDARRTRKRNTNNNNKIVIIFFILLTLILTLIPLVSLPYYHHHYVNNLATFGGAGLSWWSYDAQFFALNPNTSLPWVIFYNIYVPPPATDNENNDNNDDGIENAHNIIAEQLLQISQSYASGSKWNKTVTIFYNTIGNNELILMPKSTSSSQSVSQSLSWMEQQCRKHNLSCRHMQHYNTGQEDVTLQRLYDFCHVHHSSHYSVVYLHSKGSFHSGKSNNNNTIDNKKKKNPFPFQNAWRQVLTAAATHRSCLQQQQNENEKNDKDDSFPHCDTCSLLLQPLPSIHYPGNMWTASCHYIRKLIPPNQFVHHMEQVVNSYKKIRDSTLPENKGMLLNTTFFPQMPHIMGRQRFAAEHWLGSNPSIQPCDLSDYTPNLTQWLVDVSTTTFAAASTASSKEEFLASILSSTRIRRARAPRFALTDIHWDFYRYGKLGSMVLQNEDMRRRDYFLLAGQIHKWIQLYHTIPANNSWVWDWFPDGEFWKNAVARHGAEHVLVAVNGDNPSKQ